MISATDPKSHVPNSFDGQSSTSLTVTVTNLNADLPRNLLTSKMMKFRQFLQKRRGKTVTSKGVEQFIHQGV
jgi:hypothetical protein